jgi:hypothetical protein
MLKPQYAINLPFNGIIFTFQPFVVCHWGWFRVAMHEKKKHVAGGYCGLDAEI